MALGSWKSSKETWFGAKAVTFLKFENSKPELIQGGGKKRLTFCGYVDNISKD